MAYEAKGLYFEEFEIGKIYESQGRTILEADLINFAGLTGDFNPLHTNEEFAKKNGFGKRIAHGMLGAAIMTGMSNQMGIFEGTTIAFLSLQMDYKVPIFINDTVHLDLMPIEKKVSSKPGRGIVNYQANLVNQNDEIVTQAIWTIMMKSKER